MKQHTSLGSVPPFLLAAALMLSSLISAQAVTGKELLEAAGFRGGVILHLGSGTGELTADLYQVENSLVVGLERDADTVASARDLLFDRGLAGKVTVEHWTTTHLPFSENFINLIVCEDAKAIEEAEWRRVLTPEGVFLSRNSETDEWLGQVKERPWTIDDWPQHFYAASGNAVSKDKEIKPPLFHLQWTGSPRWSRHHDVMSSLTACVSAGGRLFYIFDEGTTFSPYLPTKWTLIARDAFNGTILWKRAIPKWFPNLHRLKSGPSNLPRRLVATKDRVYVTLGIEAKVSVLDAVTGTTLQEVEGSEGTEEIVLEQSTNSLFLMADQNEKPELKKYPYSTLKSVPDRGKKIMRVNMESAAVQWHHYASMSAPLSLCVDERHAYYFDGESVLALGKEDGVESWRSESIPVLKNMPTNFGPRMVAVDQKVLFTGGENYKPHNGSQGQLTAINAADGKTLWKAASPPSGYQSPEDLLVINGLVWQGNTTQMGWNGSTGEITGVDVKGGAEELAFKPDQDAFWFHHRCYPAKATEDFMLLSRTGIEMVDLRKKEWTLHHWVRGACLFGVLPANGLVYAPPHPCACYIGAKLYGFTALSAKNAFHPVWKATPDEQKLVKGAAPSVPYAKAHDRADEEWPVYRQNNRRRGSVPTALKGVGHQEWKVELGGDLTPPVIAGQTVIVVEKDKHAVHALDAATGKANWRYDAGCPIDSTPTIHRHRVYFGGTDGMLTCLDLASGAVIWHYQAAPASTRHMFFESLESTHPLHGSVLIHDDRVYAVAGRSMFVDGGMRFLILNADTGELVREILMDDKVPGTGEPLQLQQEILNMPQALNDLLSTDGARIYMRLQDFDLEGNRLELKYKSKLYGKSRDELEIMHSRTEDQQGEGAHIISGTGYLDDSWWHRTYWTYGKNYTSGWSGYYQAGKKAPSGRILCYDDEALYGFGRMVEYYKWSTLYEYYLYQRGYDNSEAWGVKIPILVRAMLLSGDKLYISGPEEILKQARDSKNLHLVDTKKLAVEQDEAFHGKRGAMLLEVDRRNGAILGGYELPTNPVFDGMASAYGKMFVSMSDGSVLCLGSAESGPALAAVPAKAIAEFNADSKVVPPSEKRKNQGNRKQRVFKFKLGDDLAAANAPYVVNRNLKISARVIPTKPSGVILAHGGNVIGYSLYLNEGKLTWASRAAGKLTSVTAPDPFPENGAMVGAFMGRDGTLKLAIDGVEVATAEGQAIKGHPADGLTVGDDLSSPVAEYEASDFAGEISDLTLSLTN